MKFVYPWVLALAIPVMAAMFWYWRHRRPASLGFSGIDICRALDNRYARRLVNTAGLLRAAAVFCLIIALAQPQKVLEQERVTVYGVDMVLALDISYSMNAEDLAPSRLENAKLTLADFIRKRTHDRMALLVFGGDAYTVTPLTTDQDILIERLKDIAIGDGGDGTAIGSAIATSLNRLKRSDASSRVIILLTDGENNKGFMDPMTAANLAKEMGVKIYTVGVGKEGGAPIPFYHPKYGKQYLKSANGQRALTRLDERSLQQLATQSNGRYFRARDAQELQEIYEQIDALETYPIQAQYFQQSTDYFPQFLLLALVLLLAEQLVLRGLGRVRP